MGCAKVIQICQNELFTLIFQVLAILNYCIICISFGFVLLKLDYCIISVVFQEF